MTATRRDLGLGGTAKAVLRALCDRANDEGVTWVGEEALVADTEFSRSAVFDALKALRKQGLVRRTRVDGKLAWRVAVPEPSPPAGLVPVATGPPAGLESPRAGLKSPPAGPEASVSNKKRQSLERALALDLEPPQPKPEAKKRATALPDGFVLTDARRAYAVSKGMPPSVADDEFEAFRDKHGCEKGTLSRDWDATWRTWCRNYLKFNRNGHTNGRSQEVHYS